MSGSRSSFGCSYWLLAISMMFIQLMLLFMTSGRDKGFFALDVDDVVSYLAPAAIYDSITNMLVHTSS
jgi:hypothetical protein